VFYWAWPKGLEIVPANTAAVFGGLVPVITCLLSWAFLHETFGWYEGVGMLFVFAALLLGIDWHHKAHLNA
jgi:drug/metabolite transporter (DMT)-like permease